MNHRAHVVITTTSGSIGAHFSLYLNPAWPYIGGSNYTKLMERDDDAGPRITVGNLWDQTITIVSPGVFILDLADWDDGPNASVELQIDGQTVWLATGSSDNYQNWNIITQATSVKVTDDREIAIYLPPD